MNRDIKRLMLAASLALLAACASKPLPPHPPVAQPTAPPLPQVVDPPRIQVTDPHLAPVASWTEYRRRAARLIQSANSSADKDESQPAQWYGIATVTVRLHSDGTVRDVELLRRSTISPEVNALAVEAVKRTARFGSVAHLPQPWQFNETFLYKPNRRFQLDTIVAKM